MAGTTEPGFSPRVKAATTTQSLNVQSIMKELDRGVYFVPDYQRDSSQWDLAKKSLFIDSLINNMTIPPISVYPEDDPNTGRERREIVDGQQRLTTISEFIRDTFPLANEEDVEYAENLAPLVQERTFSQLPADIRDQIERYTINLIVLPKNLDLSLRLEIFRRINEAGVPLSPHDLRLAVFGQCDRGYFIRLAGVFDSGREGAARMLKSGKDKYGLDHPWKNAAAWRDWWADSAQADGQSASQMFLYYVLSRDLKAIQTIVESHMSQQALAVKYDRTTISVLDIYLAQLHHEAKKPDIAPKILAPLGTLKEWFQSFELWFNAIKTVNVPKISPNSATKIAQFIAGASIMWGTPDKVTEEQWESIQVFLTQGPTRIQEALGEAFPISRGKWPGQKTQIEKTFELCLKIAGK